MKMSDLPPGTLALCAGGPVVRYPDASWWWVIGTPPRADENLADNDGLRGWAEDSWDDCVVEVFAKELTEAECLEVASLRGRAAAEAWAEQRNANRAAAPASHGFCKGVGLWVTHTDAPCGWLMRASDGDVVYRSLDGKGGLWVTIGLGPTSWKTVDDTSWEWSADRWWVLARPLLTLMRATTKDVLELHRAAQMAKATELLTDRWAAGPPSGVP